MTIMAHLLAALLLMSADSDISAYATSGTDSTVTVEYDTLIIEMGGGTGGTTASPSSKGTNADPAEASAGNIDGGTGGPATGSPEINTSTTSVGLSARDTTPTASVPTTQAIHRVTFEASTTFTELNYTEELANSSSSTFIQLAEQFSSQLKMAYCTAAITGNCSIEIEVTGFGQGSLIIDYIIIYSDTSETAVDDFKETILDLKEIVIRNDQGEAYAIIYTAPVVIVTASSISQGSLTCYTCTTSNESDTCSTGQEVASLSTQQCLEGQRCLTVFTKNETYTLITRGCQPSYMCNENNMNSAPYCEDSQTSGTKCSHCCNSDNCNSLDSGTAGIRDGLFTWLILGLSLLTTGSMRL